MDDATTDAPADARDERRLAPQAAVLMFVGMACFGSATPVSRIVGRSFPVWLGSTTRMAVAALVLAPLVVVRRRRHGQPGLWRTVRSMGTPDRWRLAAVGLVGTFAFTAFMLVGMREAPGAVGAIVMATTPAVTAVASVLFLGDRLTRWTAISIVLAVTGVVVVNVFGGTGSSGGDLVVLGSILVFAAVCCEATYTLVGMQLSDDLDPMSLTLVAAVVAIVGFAPLAVWDLVGFDWSAPSPSEWLGALWWGAGTMALGSVLWFLGNRSVSGTTASVFMGVMPVSALVLSYVLLDEPFEWIHVLGMVTVLAGVALTTWTGEGHGH
ncbi:MAG: DMT family transporter [Acidimicrobiia bacterium]